ncbi:MAG TPA: gephyrin-like molybdotransferase Glp [Gemmatimonadaceae bacterium]|nr:gephyrin-like molybdotransferase Glp [Gemmatimonadaceae bacterium]
MLSVGDAARRIVEEIRCLPIERVPILDAAGRVLAVDAVSPITLPPWTNSAMDGYAVIAADIESASAESPVRLPVAETIPAGGFPSRALRRGEAMRIMTGAPLPDGADTVVRVEDSDGGVDQVEIRAARDARRNVRPRGEDLEAGETVLSAGAVLGAAQIGVLASIGMSAVDVHRRPRVAILGSGDELVDLDRFHEALAGRKIVSSNNYTLHTLVRAAGGEPLNLGIVADEPAALREGLLRSAGCDLIVTSAGISVGEFDYTRDVLEELGAEMRFWKVRMRPGAPLGFGILRGTPWIGLPGNPVSAMVTFELFVRPAIRKMLGHRLLFRRPVPVMLEEPVTIGAKLTHFLRAVVTAHPDGRLTARLTGPQGSGILTSMSRANALLIVPEDRPRSEPGESLDALLLVDDAMWLAEPAEPPARA